MICELKKKQEDMEETEIKQLSLTKDIKSAVQKLKENCEFLGLQFRGKTPADGNCFFYAVSNQLQRLREEPRLHYELRRDVVKFLQRRTLNDTQEASILAEGYNNVEYFNNMRQNGTWADHVIIDATAKYLQRNIKIVKSSPQSSTRNPSSICEEIQGGEGEPILLGHIHENHYQSLRKKNEPGSDLDLGRPYPLIEIENGKPKLNKDNLVAFQGKMSADNEVIVISVMGPYRTGKSSIQTLWSGLGDRGFEWNSEKEACTSGVWMYCLHVDGKEVILMDSQGMDNAEDKKNDLWISLFAILASSVVVFNKQGRADETLLRKLYTISHYVKSNFNTETWKTPKLYLLLRDYNLDSEDTFESLLEGETSEEKTEIKNYFKEHQSFNLRFPCLRPDKIENWSYKNENIDEDFRNKAKLIWSHLTDSGNLFHRNENIATLGEWTDFIPDVVEKLDLAFVSTTGRKLDMNLSPAEHQYRTLELTKSSLLECTGRVAMFTWNCNEAFTIKDSMITLEKLQSIVDSHSEEILTSHEILDEQCTEDFKMFVSYVKDKSSKVWDCLGEVCMNLFAERNLENFEQFLNKRHSENKNEIKKVLEFMQKYFVYIKSETSEDQSESTDDAKKKNPEKTDDAKKKNPKKNRHAEEKSSKPVNLIELFGSPLKEFLQKKMNDDNIRNGFMESFEVFFLGKNLRGLTSVWMDLHSRKWEPWMKDSLFRNLRVLFSDAVAIQLARSALVELMTMAQKKHHNDSSFPHDDSHGQNEESNLLNDDSTGQNDEDTEETAPKTREMIEEEAAVLLDRFGSKVSAESSSSLNFLSEFFSVSLTNNNKKAELKQKKNVLNNVKKGHNITNIAAGCSLGVATAVVGGVAIWFPPLIPAAVGLGFATGGVYAANTGADIVVTKGYQDTVDEMVKTQHKMSSHFMQKFTDLLVECANQPIIQHSDGSFGRNFAWGANAFTRVAGGGVNIAIPIIRFTAAGAAIVGIAGGVFDAVLVGYSIYDLKQGSVHNIAKYIDQNLKTNFIPLEKVEPIMMFAFYVLLRTFLEQHQNPDKFSKSGDNIEQNEAE